MEEYDKQKPVYDQLNEEYATMAKEYEKIYKEAEVLTEKRDELEDKIIELEEKNTELENKCKAFEQDQDHLNDKQAIKITEVRSLSQRDNVVDEKQEELTLELDQKDSLIEKKTLKKTQPLTFKIFNLTLSL